MLNVSINMRAGNKVFSCHVIYHELIGQQKDGNLYRFAIIVSELFMTHDKSVEYIAYKYIRNTACCRPWPHNAQGSKGEGRPTTCSIESKFQVGRVEREVRLYSGTSFRGISFDDAQFVLFGRPVCVPVCVILPCFRRDGKVSDFL